MEHFKNSLRRISAIMVWRPGRKALLIKVRLKMKTNLAAIMLMPMIMFPALAQEILPATGTPAQSIGGRVSLPVEKAGLPHLVEPKLRLKLPAASLRPRIALTFDACMGQADERILSFLVEQRIPATLFVTARWLKRNGPAIGVLKAHPDLFDIENHGENHIPAIDIPVSVYGIASAGSPEAVNKEVANGAAAIVAAGFAPSQWFRGATAKYDAGSIRQIRAMGFKVAGYSINGDGGSLLGASMAEKRFAAAKDGDVIIAHINQPTHEAGAGVVKGIQALQRRGAQFVRLQDVDETGEAGTTN